MLTGEIVRKLGIIAEENNKDLKKAYKCYQDCREIFDAVRVHISAYIHTCIRRCIHT